MKLLVSQTLIWSSEPEHNHESHGTEILGRFFFFFLNLTISPVYFYNNVLL